MQDRARAVNRLQKTLEATNLTLGDVATNIMGKSARDMLEARLAGQTDPAALADLARGRLKAKRTQLEEALVGTVKYHHRFMLSEQLALIDTLEEAIERISREIAHRLDLSPDPDAGAQHQAASPQEVQLHEHPSPCIQEQHQQEQPLTWKQAVDLLDTIPGINARAAEGIWRRLVSRWTASQRLLTRAPMGRCMPRKQRKCREATLRQDEER